MCLTCALRVSYVCRARYVPQSIEGTLTRGHDVYVAVQFGSSFDSATLLSRQICLSPRPAQLQQLGAVRSWAQVAATVAGSLATTLQCPVVAVLPAPTCVPALVRLLLFFQYKFN